MFANAMVIFFELLHASMRTCSADRDPWESASPKVRDDL
jgi:hypothetical protein